MISNYMELWYFILFCLLQRYDDPPDAYPLRADRLFCPELYRKVRQRRMLSSQHNGKGMHTEGRLGQSADKVASCSAGGGTELLSCAVGAVVVTEQSNSGHGTEQ